MSTASNKLDLDIFLRLLLHTIHRILSAYLWPYRVLLYHTYQTPTQPNTHKFVPNQWKQHLCAICPCVPRGPCSQITFQFIEVRALCKSLEILHNKLIKLCLCKPQFVHSSTIGRGMEQRNRAVFLYTSCHEHHARHPNNNRKPSRAQISWPDLWQTWHHMTETSLKSLSSSGCQYLYM